MLSNVPNTAMLTGTARTSVGARPRQNTRDPDSAYIALAVPHVLSACCCCCCCCCAGSGKQRACMRVLSTSNGNVATHPSTPAAPPARSSAAHERWASASVSCISPGAGAQRRSVASYCRTFQSVREEGKHRIGHARRRSTSRNHRHRAGSSRRARGIVRARRPHGRCAMRLCVRALRVHLFALKGAVVASAAVS